MGRCGKWGKEWVRVGKNVLGSLNYEKNMTLFTQEGLFYGRIIDCSNTKTIHHPSSPARITVGCQNPAQEV